MRPALLAASLFAMLVAITACGAVPTPAGTSPTPYSGHVVLATEADNGSTLQVHVGDELKLQLASTYWIIAGSSDQKVLRSRAPAAVSPQQTGCVPGAGCGTVTMLFDVVGPGSAFVSASRNSCGEAMGCTAAEASFKVTVTAAQA